MEIRSDSIGPVASFVHAPDVFVYHSIVNLSVFFGFKLAHVGKVAGVLHLSDFFENILVSIETDVFQELDPFLLLARRAGIPRDFDCQFEGDDDRLARVAECRSR